MDDDEMVKRAFRAYFREYGETADQPSSSSGVEQHGDQQYVVLQNANGVLAVYLIYRDGVIDQLRRLDPSDDLYPGAAELLEYDMRPFHVERHTDDGHVILHLTSEVGNFGVDPQAHLMWALDCLRIENDVIVYRHEWEFDVEEVDDVKVRPVTITSTLEVELSAASWYADGDPIPDGVLNGSQTTTSFDSKHPVQLGVVDVTRMNDVRRGIRLP